MLSMKFGRDAEREADLLGLEYEYAAGYDPQAFVQFFEKLHAKRNRTKMLQKKPSLLIPRRKTAFVAGKRRFPLCCQTRLNMLWTPVI